jgi:superfamily I DNA/RNA helicase
LNQLGSLGISRESLDVCRKVMATGPENPADLLLTLAGVEIVDSRDAVTVGTIHSAKGHEYTVVYLPAWEESIMPNTRPGTDIEEERRLAFVGLTRAAELAVVSWAKSRKPHQWARENTTMKPSRFIGEMGAKQ